MIAWNKRFAVRLHSSRRFDPRAVVRCEDNQCVVVDLQFPERPENLATRPIDLFDRVTVWSAAGLALEALRRADRNVGQVMREIQEEWLFVVFTDPRNCFTSVVGRDVVPAFDGLDFQFPVAKNRAAERSVLHHHRESVEHRCTVEVVKPLSIWHRRGIKSSGPVFLMGRQVPLPQHSCRVACVSQDFRHRDFFRVRHRVQVLDVAWFTHTNGIATRHQRSSRYTANGLRIEAGQTKAFVSHAIEVWRLDIWRTKAPQILIPLIIRENQNDVGAVVGACVRRMHKNENQCGG